MSLEHQLRKFNQRPRSENPGDTVFEVHTGSWERAQELVGRALGGDLVVVDAKVRVRTRRPGAPHDQPVATAVAGAVAGVMAGAVAGATTTAKRARQAAKRLWLSNAELILAADSLEQSARQSSAAGDLATATTMREVAVAFRGIAEAASRAGHSDAAGLDVWVRAAVETP